MLEVVEEELVAGVTLAGKFKLEHPIGQGGFGVVWAAIDLATGERRALKCLTRDGATNAKRQERLRREARVMSSIVHPHIARVFGVEELSAGTPFIVMELLEGPSLHTHLLGGPLSMPQTRGILIQISDALRTVHARGIVHRDLKPANVIIVGERIAKVLDFGIAKDLSSIERHRLTTTGTTLGTLAYMAPEQVYGERVIDGRCDVWALGILAHECLTLSRPTDSAENSGQVLKAILEGKFRRLSSLVPDCPRDLDELVARMLSRNPVERPTSEEVFDTLARPALAPTVSLGKTNHMLETLPIPDAPMFARTVHDAAFARTHLAPSNGVATTVAPATITPSTVIPSTVMPSTVIPSTVAAPHASPAAAVTPASGHPMVFAATMLSAPHGTPDGPTFVRAREHPRRLGFAIAIASVAGIAAVGIFIAFARTRSHSTPTLGQSTVASASVAPSASAAPVDSTSPVAASASSAAIATTASAPVTSAQSRTAPSGRTAPAPQPTTAKKKTDDPPISNERF